MKPAALATARSSISLSSRTGHHHARERGARLARVEVALEDAIGDGGRQVGVLEDDVGRLAAKFERDTLYHLGGELHHSFAGARRSGEGDHVGLRVSHDRLTDDGTESGQHIEDALGKTDVVHDLGEEEGVDRRDLARLQDDGAARGEGRRDLVGDLVQRVVPRRDRGDDADGLANERRVADLLLPDEVHGSLRVVGEGHRGQSDLDAL